MAQKGKRIAPELKAEVVTLYVDGWTAEQVAKELEMSTATVLKILRQLDIPRRSLKEWSALRAVQEKADIQALLRGNGSTPAEDANVT